MAVGADITDIPGVVSEARIHLARDDGIYRGADTQACIQCRRRRQIGSMPDDISRFADAGALAIIFLKHCRSYRRVLS